MDIPMLNAYQARPWPSKPQELLDLEDLIHSPHKRRERNMDMVDVYRIRDKIMESEETQQYMKKNSQAIADNYGNYDWLLTIQKEQGDILALELQKRLEELLQEFRQIYDVEERKNLPVSKLIRIDLAWHAQQSNPKIDKLKEIFDGKEINE